MCNLNIKSIWTKTVVIFFTSVKPSYIVMFLRTFALILVVCVSYIIYLDINKNIALIGALGILVSALLASYSVILSINTTVDIKKRDISSQIRYLFFHLCRIKSHFLLLEKEREREKVSFMDIDRIFDTMFYINGMLTKVDNYETISNLHNDVLANLNILFLEIDVLYTYTKSLRDNIKRPEPAGESTQSYGNPLIAVNFNLQKSINKIDVILVYLKTGYKEYFPSSLGIEMCAEYSLKHKEQN